MNVRYRERRPVPALLRPPGYPRCRSACSSTTVPSAAAAGPSWAGRRLITNAQVSRRMDSNPRGRGRLAGHVLLSYGNTFGALALAGRAADGRYHDLGDRSLG